MHELPEGYTRLDSLPISSSRMYCLRGFASKEDAEKRIKELQQNFPSPRYHYHPHIQILGMMPEHMILLPENALRFLREEEKALLGCVVTQPPNRIALRHNIAPDLVLYKFMKEKYADQFFETGALLLSTFERCNNLPDANRRDQEGRLNSTAVYDTKKVVMDIGVGSNIILFSTSTTPEYTPPDGKKEECVIEIHGVRRFFELITQELTQNGLRVMDVLNGPCTYTGRDTHHELVLPTIEKILDESDSSNKFDFGLFGSIAAEIVDDESYFLKPEQNSYENEYRFLWLLDSNVDKDFYVVNLPKEARDLCQKIILR